MVAAKQQSSHVSDYAVELFSLVLLLFGDVCSQGDHSLPYIVVEYVCLVPGAVYTRRTIFSRYSISKNKNIYFELHMCKSRKYNRQN